MRAIIIAAAIMLILRLFVLDFARVDGPSMRRTFLTGDRLVVTKIPYYFGDPRHGDIVVCSYPHYSDRYVKRVLAVGGDTIECRDGVIYLNGEALNEPYLSATAGEDFEPVTVPEGSFFVVGDNRDRSSDSRLPEIGAISGDAIYGKAIFVLWPLGDMRII